MFRPVLILECLLVLFVHSVFLKAEEKPSLSPPEYDVRTRLILEPQISPFAQITESLGIKTSTKFPPEILCSPSSVLVQLGKSGEYLTGGRYQVGDKISEAGTKLRCQVAPEPDGKLKVVLHLESSNHHGTPNEKNTCVKSGIEIEAIRTVKPGQLTRIDCGLMRGKRMILELKVEPQFDSELTALQAE